MKSLVVYATSKGYVQECVENLIRESNQGLEAWNLKKNKGTPNLDVYDEIIIGSGIHASQVFGPVKKFCQKNEAELLKKHIGIFLCSVQGDNLETMVKNNFSPELVEHCSVTGWFGGRIIMSEHNVLIRAMLKKIQGSAQDVHTEQPEAIKQFLADLIASR